MENAGGGRLLRCPIPMKIPSERKRLGTDEMDARESNQVEELTRIFRLDLRNIAEAFIESFGLAFGQAISNLADPAVRWVDFAFRYIEPMSRRWEVSQGFWQRAPKENVITIDRFLNMVRRGHQSLPGEGVVKTRRQCHTGHKQN